MAEIDEQLYKELIDKIKTYHPSDDFSMVEKAYKLSSLPCRRQDDAENPETRTGCGLGKRLSLRSERLGFQPLGIIGTEFLVHVTKPCTGIELLELGT